MRQLYALGSFAVLFIIVIAGVGFLMYRSTAALEPGILRSQMDKLSAVWSAENTPASKRTVNFIISDAKPSSDRETYTVLFKRIFFRKSMAAEENTAFAKSFSDEPNTITWTHKGKESASDDEMARELMKAILKADDLGAEINIITQGISAVSALKTIKQLGTPLGGNKSIEINKLIAVDMNMPTLKKIDSSFFMNYKKPGNLKEWVNTWTNKQGIRKIEIYNQGRWKTFTGNEIMPAMELSEVPKPERAEKTGSSDMAEVTELIKNLMSEYGMKAMLNYMAKLVNPDFVEETVAVVARDLKGRAYQREVANKNYQGSSLGAVSGGDWLKKEMEKAEKEIGRKSSKRSSGKETKTSSGDWRKDGNASNCKLDRNGRRRCNWYDAMAYCGGNLPTVAQLKTMYKNECTGGRKAKTCRGWHWSSEDSTRGSASARDVHFYDGNVSTIHKHYDSSNVRCR